MDKNNDGNIRLITSISTKIGYKMFNELDIVEAKYNIYLVKIKKWLFDYSL
ncbi:hypothetical protein [Campylobacter concisus]|uniref:Uncharacterized protein n=1 Tax=Campylobacter concisus TaxID=199 RepID=A0A7S9RED6_9BACT|nr:hypothetical protein [Campylobacter concisus]QPH90221.1 hypothetical protein CVT00_01375 [Campylobacter concisus]